VLALIEPARLASLAISAAVVVLFLANFLIALGEPAGTAGNVRMLQFLAPAEVAVAAILIVAVALVVLLPTSDPPGTPSLLSGATVRAIAGFVSGAVAAAAFVRAIVALTIAHERVLLKLGTLVDALAAVMLAAVGAYWALKPKLSQPPV
jgi:hypothetical protein